MNDQHPKPPARDASVVLHGMRLHYVTHGEHGAPLLLLHGSGLTAHAYDDLAAGLAARGFHVVAPDLRGHGESDRAADYHWQRALEDLEGLLARLDLGPLAVVGHSMGARLGAILAGRYPAAVRRLVLLDWAPDAAFAPAFREALGQLWALPHIADPGAVVAAMRQRTPTLREPLFRRAIESGLEPRPGGGWRWRFDREALDGGAQAFPIDETTAAAHVERIRCPTLVVRAEWSEYVTRRQAERLARLLYDGRHVEVPACGHGLPWEQPEAVLEAVLGFLVGGGGRAVESRRSP